MQKCKIKKQAEVKVQKSKSISETINEIQKDFVIQTILIIITIILTLIVCFGNIRLARDYDILKQEKQELERLTETQSSMIADLEENLRDLFVQTEDLKEGVVYGRNLERY